ncbi:MAG: ester cyclase [Actinomycetota bacterium]
MKLEANKALVRRHFEELWLKGDLGVADEIYSPATVGHWGDAPDHTGYPAFERDEVARSNEAFPDTSVTIDFQIAEDDRVVTRWRFEGSHTGPGYGDPTGRNVLVTGIHVHRVAEGRIVEIWAHPNNLSFMQQLGMIPVDS